jgi:hypothetical protein
MHNISNKEKQVNAYQKELKIMNELLAKKDGMIAKLGQ